MSETSDNQNQVADPSRLDRCPECGYSRSGLPEQGLCPECGARYDTSQLIVLYGWSLENPLGVGGWARFALAQVLLWGSLLSLQTLLTYLHIHISFWVAYGAASSLICLVEYWCIRRWLRSNERTGPDQLHLSPEGFGWRTGYGPCRLQPWQDSQYLRIKPRRRQLRRLEIITPHQVNPQYSGHVWLRFDFKADAANAQSIAAQVEQWRQERKRSA